MLFKKMKNPKTNQAYLEVSLTDSQLLRSPLLNKGMAFPHAERETFNLLGLLPPAESNLKDQCLRSYQAFKSKPSALQKYIYLRDLQDSNETLFYTLLSQYLEEMLPIVYTPTVGEGCQQFSHIYRHPRGLYLAYPYRNKLDQIFAHPRFNHVKAIVVSDGERILGLGDQGAGGMGIPIGKLSLYTACAGIHPAETLPVLLDTGTNNEELRADSLYIGWRHERIRGEDYDNFIECFVNSVKKRYPHVLLQWEDFAKQNANRILERYKDELCTFNDDIQGTAAIAVGTILAALHITKMSLSQQRIVIFGAGGAGCGIAKLFVSTLIAQGIKGEEAYRSVYLIDRSGLMMEGVPHALPFQIPFLKPRAMIENWKLKDPSKISLLDTILNAKPSILLGVSGQGGVFTEEIIKAMAAHVENPIIFPLSNPTSNSEAIPQDLMTWTNDKAIISTGSPFGNIFKNKEAFHVDQTNNSYIFPGIGLGLIASQSTRATDNMFMIAAKILADCSPAKTNPKANLLPKIPKIREVSYKIGLAVAKEAVAQGLSLLPAHEQENLENRVKETMWTPEYLPYVLTKT